ncbi:hypothetical protein F5Y04DRAFT_291497 [Hypomontagnella monticulosa]|nr:hypothetical protein F5Y04DRAFT_291497 [Hypomontagnella monticulosa]
MSSSGSRAENTTTGARSRPDDSTVLPIIDQSVWRKRLFDTSEKKPHPDRYVAVCWYHDRIRVDIRGYATSGDKLKPLTQGISLTLQEFECLDHFLPEIKKQIEKMKEDDAEERTKDYKLAPRDPTKY